MRCYYHPEKEAIGLCKYCQRGLCEACATEVEEVLSCRDRHEGKVRQRMLFEARSLLQSQRAASAYMRNATFYGLVGLLFCAFGAIQYRFLGLQAVFFILIGLFLLYAAAANFFEGRRLK